MVANPKIQDYAVIGEGRSAALVSRGGSLDWLCWPRFDSPALFARLLDEERGGHWSIAPTQPHSTTRRYVEETNVLETRFAAATDSAFLTDFMPAASEGQKRSVLWPEQELVRHVECEQGEIELAIDFQPRPDFARGRFAIQDGGRLGMRIDMGSWLITLRSDAKFKIMGQGATAHVKLRAGESTSFSLSYSAEAPAVLAPLGEAVLEKLDLTTAWWQRWAGGTKYEGPYRDQVVRSALALKLLSFAPSGAIVAAPTTSLPERLGGDLNWDYRFCWLRDAAFTARALFGLGFREEAEAFVSWTLHATRLTRPELRVIYDVYGEANPDETEMTHLRGYGGSSPVRLGNATRNQLQLDVYGEVVEAVAYFVNQGGNLDRETQAMLRHFGSYVCRHWHEPDNGIWEPRDKRQHFTHSKVMCWVALDRLLELHQQGQLPNIPAQQFAQSREKLRRYIEDSCWNAALEAYTDAAGSEMLDTSVLVMACHGFDEASSWRMQQTYRRIQERLGAGPGLVYRYEKSFEGREGAFAISCFWMADFLARGGGSLAEARESFEHTLAYANDLGLFAEEIDPASGDALGNFPQGFTHLGLINAALSITEREKKDEEPGTSNQVPGTSSQEPVHQLLGPGHWPPATSPEVRS